MEVHQRSASDRGRPPYHLELPCLAWVVSNQELHHLQVLSAKVMICTQVVEAVKNQTKRAVQLAHGKILADTVTRTPGKGDETAVSHAELVARANPTGGIELCWIGKDVGILMPGR